MLSHLNTLKSFLLVLYTSFFIFLAPIYLMGFPIDIVYTWVDGEDALWRAEYIKTSQNPKKNFVQNSNDIQRYRSRNELKYSLRSVLKYAPFVQKIYIVTAGQKPDWLQENERIKIIHHKEIFSDLTVLPTFNSQAIEANIHKIPGLSEHYIYLNDDMLFTKAVTPEDFFKDSDSICISFEKNLSPELPIVVSDEAFYSSCKNTNALLDNVFIKERRPYIAHAAYPMKKSIAAKAEKKFKGAFQLVISHAFRNHSDYTITNGLIPYYAHYTNRSVQSNLKARTITIIGEKPNRMLRKIKSFKKHRGHMLCIQDKMIQEDNKEREIVEKFLRKFFPKPAPWEKIKTTK